ncbi:hypothetical protein FNF29_00283 [Cafeteria roenbergensis]|uniref:Uncharacterized protein n=1 Tax=Cafeteria roenbergensis TaxID=33653 RepID=A0A5A8CK95_CAFRO|nr:hypothetical protein FNF31_06457 [Cafeteria roenbergensis]KAA0157709.1 hypothetical protein FNF29_00283 [Cafeteria roenbergensis]|eukprot:KAA0157709.1 hypothetical protein FNF29_00283 [Cafeteria roenbergensis]
MAAADPGSMTRQELESALRLAERRVATMQKVLVKQDAAVRELQGRVSEVSPCVARRGAAHRTARLGV